LIVEVNIFYFKTHKATRGAVAGSRWIGSRNPCLAFVLAQNKINSGIVVIAYAYRTEDPGFKSRQGVRFSGIYTLQCWCQNLVPMYCHCVYLRKITEYKNIKYI
jgi:hypothetical protein